MSGVVHVMDPRPYDYSFGSSEEEQTKNNLRYLEEVIMYEGPQNIAAMFVETVTGTNGVLPPPKGYMQGLKKLLEGYQIYSMDEFTALFSSNNIPALTKFTRVMIGISIFIGFAVVCLSMYMAVLQRTREIGILKSLGASRWYVISIILREAVLLALVGTVLGIGMSYAAKWLLQTLVPASFPPAVDPAWWPAAAAIALLGAVLGALYPGLRAARMDPIEALSYE